MKTLKDHTILYDEVCPLCSLYTKAFIDSGMLDKDGREPYQKLPPQLSSKVDCRRAVNEIALVNNKTGQVYYGVKSLFAIISNSFPVFSPLFQFKPFAWMADKAYKFISYNRRVMMPSKKETAFYYEPSFNIKYRLLYLIFTWITTAFILFKYSKFLTGIILPGNFYRESFICGGQILWQTIFIFFLHKRKRWDYLGNMMTISFAGSLALLFIIGISQFTLQIPSLIYAGCFMLVAALMFLEHIRRTKLLAISWILTASWVSYRIILLFFIIN